MPHGHNNMCTGFIVLRGEFDGKHYDRVEDRADHYLIRKTVDRVFKPGEFSTVSDHKDNIHWFTARSDTGFIFNLHVIDIRPDNTEPTGRLYLDPNGEKLADGTIRAERISYDEANKRYG